MRKVYLVALVLLWSCSVEPTALRYGQDACYTCKMTLMDKKFGAEVVTVKGKVYTFDDVNCMINFLNSGAVEEREVAYRLVVDFANPSTLIDASNSLYIKSDKIRSPMGSSVAAFEKKENLDAFNKEWKGILMSWGELVTQFK
jgi:copper chaperone NosL